MTDPASSLHLAVQYLLQLRGRKEAGSSGSSNKKKLGSGKTKAPGGHRQDAGEDAKHRRRAGPFKGCLHVFSGVLINMHTSENHPDRRTLQQREGLSSHGSFHPHPPEWIPSCRTGHPVCISRFVPQGLANQLKAECCCCCLAKLEIKNQKDKIASKQPNFSL